MCPALTHSIQIPPYHFICQIDCMCVKLHGLILIIVNVCMHLSLHFRDINVNFQSKIKVVVHVIDTYMHGQSFPNYSAHVIYSYTYVHVQVISSSISAYKMIIDATRSRLINAPECRSGIMICY